jgi:hypothetical protein
MQIQSVEELVQRSDNLKKNMRRKDEILFKVQVIKGENEKCFANIVNKTQL